MHGSGKAQRVARILQAAIGQKTALDCIQKEIVLAKKAAGYEIVSAGLGEDDCVVVVKPFTMRAERR